MLFQKCTLIQMAFTCKANRKYSLSSMGIKIALVLRKIQEIKIFDNEYTYDTSQIIRTLVVLCGDIHRRNHDKD